MSILGFTKLFSLSKLFSSPHSEWKNTQGAQGNRIWLSVCRCVYVYNMFTGACVQACAFVHSVICMHACVCVCEAEIQPASRASLLSTSCIIPPRAQDSTLSLRVTHGEAAPCPWRTEGITALSLSVTPALSPVMPPRWQVEGSWGGEGGPVKSADRLTGDR